MRFTNINLGIVCPMASEELTVVRFVDEVLRICSGYEFKAIKFYAVLDNVSRDRTRALLNAARAQRPALQVIWSPGNRNVVDAYVRGYREAFSDGCDWILEIDAGYSHQPSDIPQFFEKMTEGYDCVFGSRFCVGGRIFDSSRRREIISRGGTLLANLLLGTDLTDMTSGFELFSRTTLESILQKGIRSRAHFFQTEIKTYCRKLRIVEVPIQYRAANPEVNMLALADSFINLSRLFRLRLLGRLDQSE